MNTLFDNLKGSSLNCNILLFKAVTPIGIKKRKQKYANWYIFFWFRSHWCVDLKNPKEGTISDQDSFVLITITYCRIEKESLKSLFEFFLNWQ